VPAKWVGANSGGVDTSVCNSLSARGKWVSREVIHLRPPIWARAPMSSKPIRLKALEARRQQSLVGDLIERSSREFGLIPAIRANALL